MAIFLSAVAIAALVFVFVVQCDALELFGRKPHFAWSLAFFVALATLTFACGSVGHDVGKWSVARTLCTASGFERGEYADGKVTCHPKALPAVELVISKPVEK